MGGDQITIRRTRQPFTVVEPEIYALHDLSLGARHVLGWLLGRSDSFVISVQNVRKVHGLSDKVWSRIRDQLKEAGFYRQTKTRGRNGTFSWSNEVTDAPLCQSPETGSCAPVPPLTPAGGEATDFLLPAELEVHRTVVRRAARQAGLNSGQLQQLADEFVGRVLDRESKPVTFPLRWLTTTAASVSQGDSPSRWGQAAARARLEAAKQKKVGKQADIPPTRRLSRAERDAMLPWAPRPHGTDSDS